jgi:hypothetical protein
MTGLQELSNDAALFAAQRPRVPQVAPATTGSAASDRQAAQARQKLAEFVGASLFGMVLSEMRKTTHNEHVLFGGRGEEALQPLLDQALVGKLALSRNFELAEAAFQKIYINTPYSPLVSPELATPAAASARARATA